jgi:NitT/TauT family transport system permease protein
MAGKVFLYKTMPLLAFFLVWELASRTGLVNRFFLPPASEALINIVTLFRNDNLWGHLGISLFRALAGFALAGLAGVPLGLFLSLSPRRLKWALEPLVEVLVQVNPFILFHILELFLGIGEPAKISVIFLTCLWPIVLSTVAGVGQVDALLLKAGRGFGGNRRQLFLKIILPAASPKMFTGFRLALGYAVFMLIAAEMMGGKSGLGWLILNEQMVFHSLNIFSLVLVIALLGLGLDSLMKSLQKKFFHYDLQAFLNSSAT